MVLTGDGENSANTECALVTLDDVIQEDVLLLKLDVSGYEGEALRGLTQAIQRYNIQNILCETKGDRDKPWKTRFINEMRDSQGYSVILYQEWYLADQWKAAGLFDSAKEILAGRSLPTLHKVVTSAIAEDSFLQGFEEVWYSKDVALMESLASEKDNAG